MKNISNQFFGSIFRTLGRVVAYVLLAILAYYVFSWFNLPNVHAATITPNTISYYGVNSGGQSVYVTNTSVNSYTIGQSSSAHIYVNGTEMVFPVSVVSGNTYFIEWDITYSTYFEQPSYSPTIAYTLNNINTTCDTNIINTITQTSATTNNYTYVHKYKCSFNSTINGNSFYFNYYTGKQQAIKSFTINFNLYREDLTNADIIQNNNSNTERTIQNQNQNTDKIVNEQKKTTQATEDLTESITSEDSPDVDLFSGIESLMPIDTPITDIITLPINVLNKTITGLGGTCQSWTINSGDLLGNHDIVIPCLNISQYFTSYSYGGYNLWQIIDLMICFFMGYEILMLIISAYNSIVNLDDTFDVLYQPRHANNGYVPKHGGGN